MADLDALAISQALTDVDPGWGEPTGSALTLLRRHGSHDQTVAVEAWPDAGRGHDWWWICASVTMRSNWGDFDRVLAALREVIWGPDGHVYVTYPPGTCDIINLVGRADGQPSPWGPP